MSTPKSPTADRSIVVLIEDDNRVAHALAMLIEDWGYECVDARTPDAAVDKLQTRMADVLAIVIDLSRNDSFTGRRSAEAIRNALGSTLPRIVTTNEPGLARAHGFSDVLAKPYDPEVLRAWLCAQSSHRMPAGELKTGGVARR